ncbi:BAHD acyltransferase DCR [Linum grandiflorum]
MPAAPSYNSSAVTVISKCTVVPDQKSTVSDLKLSASDLPMLSCHYIQKGALFSKPQFPFSSLCLLLKSSLSHTLTLFPPLAGRLSTDPTTAVQVTELADGVFVGCSVNHSVTDGTSFWNFFNTFAQVSRGVKWISSLPDFTRDDTCPLMTSAVLRLPQGGPRVTFDETAPLSERIFRFSREAVLKLKATVNGNNNNSKWAGVVDSAELMGKQSNDSIYYQKKMGQKEISSFQSLCALVWRAVTKARNLSASKTTTFRMAVNCRHRVNPKMDALYFGNAIQSIPTYASAGDVTSRELRWLAERLNENVSAYNDATVRRVVSEWEENPRCFPLGNLDGASMTMGSSPRFPMYDNDFGWGRPLAVRSGKANKFDGKMSAFPGREGGGTVDLEVVLSPETMDAIEADEEFMQFVSS